MLLRDCFVATFLIRGLLPVHRLKTPLAFDSSMFFQTSVSRIPTASSGQSWKRLKAAVVLVSSVGLFSLAGCGGEDNDIGNAPSAAANSLSPSPGPNAAANAAANSYSNGVVLAYNSSPPVQANGQPYNRAVVQRAGPGD